MNLSRLIDFYQNNFDKKFLSELLESRGEFSANQINKLNKLYPEYPIKDILSQIIIQKNLITKIPNPYQFLFTKKGSEQSSSWVMAKYHGEKFEKYKSVADLCCGIGIDLLHLSANKKKSYAVDLDIETLNTAKFNSKNTTDFLNIRAQDFDKEVEAVFIDPDRRADGVRKIHAEDLQPSWDEILVLQKEYPNLAVKLSPAMDYKRLKTPEKHTFEFVSENGKLKEILLCFGELSTPDVTRIAVILPEKKKLFFTNYTQLKISEIRKYIFEPDASIIRGGMVQELGLELDNDLIDRHLALLTGDVEISSVYGKQYEVIEYFNYNFKQLKKYLRTQEIGELVIKTRGFPESVEQFRKKLKLKGKNKSILFLLRYGKGHICLFCR